MRKMYALRIKILLSALCLLGSVGSLWAQAPSIVSNPNNSSSGFRVPGYSLTVLADYGYNYTWLSHGNLDIQAFMPVNKHVELESKLQLSTANVYTFSAIARPKFAVPVGEMFMETELLDRLVARAHQNDFCMAISVGYRMDYVSVQLGLFSRVMAPLKHNWHGEDRVISEPFNLLYRVEVFCRPQAERWNIMALITNKNDYSMERMWQPAFSLSTRYDVDKNWRILGGLECKPSGMFHLNATFYSFNARAGFAYRF